MTPLEKFRQQVAIAKASEPGVKRYVVQTADEAQAVLDEIDSVLSIKPDSPSRSRSSVDLA